MTSDDRVPVDALKYQWLQLKDKLMSEAEIEQKVGEITPIFFRGLREKLIKGEKINIVIGNTQTRKGKSTLGLFLKYTLHQMIKDLKQNTSYTDENKDEFELIASNQIEALRIFRRRDIHNVSVLVDEFSSMGKTGLGATTEESYLNWYENVSAIKRIHTIYCTPNNEYDKYGLILLEIYDINKQTKITKARVYYNDQSLQRKQLLGYISVKVEDILNKPWNKQYLTKKSMAIDMLLSNAIRDVRELEFAIVKLITFQKHRRLAELGNNDRNLIKEKITETTREIGGVYTILQTEEALSSVLGLTNLIIERNKKTKELTRTNRRVPYTEEEKEAIREEIKTYDEEIVKNISESKRLIKLYIDYMSIGNDIFANRISGILEKYNIRGIKNG